MNYNEVRSDVSRERRFVTGQRVRAIIHLVALIFFSVSHRFFNIDFCDDIDIRDKVILIGFYAEKICEL